MNATLLVIAWSFLSVPHSKIMEELMDKEADCPLVVIDRNLRRHHEGGAASSKPRGIGATKASWSPWSVENL